MVRRARKKRDFTPVIDAELDLHGHTVAEATVLVDELLDEAHEELWRRVRIIVGKGTRSANGPVLPQAIKEHLSLLGYTYTYAKQYEGGEGALDVVLRP